SSRRRHTSFSRDWSSDVCSSDLGPSLAVLQALAAACDAEAVYWTRRYEPVIERRDAGIKRALREQGLHAESFNGALLFEPWQLRSEERPCRERVEGRVVAGQFR